MAMKILNPKEDLGLDKEAWEGTRKKLEGYRKEGDKKSDWGSFAFYAMIMKILASPKVEVLPEGGLKVE